MSQTSRRQWSILGWSALIGLGLLLSVQAWDGVVRLFGPVPFHYDEVTVPDRVSPGGDMIVTGTITKSRDCAGTSAMRIVDAANVFHDLFFRSIGARPPSTYDFRVTLTVPLVAALGPAVFSIVAISNCSGSDYVDRVLRDVTIVPQ